MLSDIVSSGGTDLQLFRELKRQLCERIDATKSGRDIAALSRQLLIVMTYLQEAEQMDRTEDPIAKILDTRGQEGKVRPDRRLQVKELEDD